MILRSGQKNVGATYSPRVKSQRLSALNTVPFQRFEVFQRCIRGHFQMMNNAESDLKPFWIRADQHWLSLRRQPRRAWNPALPFYISMKLSLLKNAQIVFFCIYLFFCRSFCVLDYQLKFQKFWDKIWILIKLTFSSINLQPYPRFAFV